jgi:hypothetical protein
MHCLIGGLDDLLSGKSGLEAWGLGNQTPGGSKKLEKIQIVYQ